MKNKVRITFILTICLIIIGLGVQVKATTDLKSKIVGTWEITNLKQNGKEMTSEDSMLVDLAIGGTIKLSEDGKYTCNVAALELVDIPSSGTYVTSGEDTIKVTYDEGKTANVKYVSATNTLEMVKGEYTATLKQVAGTGNVTNEETITKDANNIEEVKEVTEPAKQQEEITKIEIKDEVKTEETKTETKKDTTTAQNKIPQTGSGITLTVMLVVLAIIALVIYKKYRNYRDI